jgi:hypothetical protein
MWHDQYKVPWYMKNVSCHVKYSSCVPEILSCTNRRLVHDLNRPDPTWLVPTGSQGGAQKKTWQSQDRPPSYCKSVERPARQVTCEEGEFHWHRQMTVGSRETENMGWQYLKIGTSITPWFMLWSGCDTCVLITNTTCPESLWNLNKHWRGYTEITADSPGTSVLILYG